MQRQKDLLILYRQFIRDSKIGKRLKPDGMKIKPQTVDNYISTLKLLEHFETFTGTRLRVIASNRLPARQLTVEVNYWKRFYKNFSEFLYSQHNCFDNFVGSVFKMIKVFFNYLEKERQIKTRDFSRHFYIRREEIPVITLTPGQLQFLITNENFRSSLSIQLKRSRDIFIFGCTVALRYCDLFNIRLRDIEKIEGNYYLSAKSQKTDTLTKVKLPGYAIEILNRYTKRKTGNARVFTSVSKSRLNKNIQKLGELAGRVDVVGKRRRKNGKEVEIMPARTNKPCRFCDLLTTHTMRRTAVTTMLMLGMPEYVVRKISGHSENSKAFYRYVNFVQSYLDKEIDRMHERLLVA